MFDHLNAFNERRSQDAEFSHAYDVRDSILVGGRREPEDLDII